MTTHTTKDVLIRARQLLESGWYQGGYSDGHGHYCLRGAISAASGLMNEDATEFVQPIGWRNLRKFSKAINADWNAARVVESHIPERWISIPMFNDDISTTQADVLAVMDKAISSC